jgi:hypothetical protein
MGSSMIIGSSVIEKIKAKDLRPHPLLSLNYYSGLYYSPINYPSYYIVK